MFSRVSKSSPLEVAISSRVSKILLRAIKACFCCSLSPLEVASSSGVSIFLIRAFEAYFGCSLFTFRGSFI